MSAFCSLSSAYCQFRKRVGIFVEPLSIFNNCLDVFQNSLELEFTVVNCDSSLSKQFALESLFSRMYALRNEWLIFAYIFDKYVFVYV